MTWKIGLLVVVCLPHVACAASSTISSGDAPAVSVLSARVSTTGEDERNSENVVSTSTAVTKTPAAKETDAEKSARLFKTTLMAGRPLRQDVPPSWQVMRRR